MTYDVVTKVTYGD